MAPPPPARAARLGRLAPPAALLAFAAVAGVLPIRSVDFFWHLATGRWMLEHRRLPRFDPFRFTSQGVPWVDHEWGFQLLLGLGERLAGLEGLILGRAALLVAIAALLLAGLRRQGVEPAAAALVALAALLGLRGRLLLRPELATLLAFTLLLLLLETLRRRGGWQPAAGILLLVAVWTNLHPGVLAAPPLVAAYLLGAWLRDRRARPVPPPPPRAEASSAPTPSAGVSARDRTPWVEATSAPTPSAGVSARDRTTGAEAGESARTTGAEAGPAPAPVRLWQVAALPAAAAAAILLNPWGYEVFLVPVHIAGALAGLPATNPDWAPVWQDPPLWLAAALAALALLLLRARRRGARLDLALGLVVLALLALLLTAARHQGMLWIAGALLAGSALGRERSGGSAEQARPLRAAAPGEATGGAVGTQAGPAGPSDGAAPGEATRGAVGAQAGPAGPSDGAAPGEEAARGAVGAQAGPAGPSEGAAPGEAATAAAASRRGRAAGGGRRSLLAAGLCLAAAGWCLLAADVPLASPHPAGFGVTEERFPGGAVAALAGWEPVGPLYNSAVFGGYLLWRLYPPRQVFYDTRNEVDPGLLREVARARTGSAAWEALLERYRIDAALVRYDERLRPVVSPPAEPGGEPAVEAHTATAFLFPPERFALVHWDDVAMLFLARTPQRAGRLAGEEFRFVQPEDWRHTLQRAAADPVFRRGVRRELEARLARDPSCRRAAGLLRLLERSPATPPPPPSIP